VDEFIIIVVMISFKRLAREAMAYTQRHEDSGAQCKFHSNARSHESHLQTNVLGCLANYWQDLLWALPYSPGP
jgi:hypothetical protein